MKLLYCLSLKNSQKYELCCIMGGDIPKSHSHYKAWAYDIYFFLTHTFKEIKHR